MGVFGAFFGRRGDAGFIGPLLGASSGVGGFNVAMFPRPVRDILRPARPDVGVSGKSSPSTLKTPQNRYFYACWENFFAEMRLEGRCWANFFAEEPLEGPCWANLFAPIGPEPRSCRRRGALQAGCGGGFCSIRSWLAACRRCVVPLVTPFPPFGDGPAEPPPGGLTYAGTRECRYAVKPRRQTIRPGHSSPAGLSTPRR